MTFGSPKKMIAETLKLYKDVGIFTKLFLLFRLAILPYAGILRLIPENVMSILDIGCGHGLFSLLLALAFDGKVVVKGIDCDEKKVKVANRALGNNQLLNRVSFECLDVERMDTLGKHDCIILIDLLHHMSFASQELLLSKIRSALSDKGVLLIKEVDEKPWWKYYWNLCHDKTVAGLSPVHYRSHEDYVRLLNSLGYWNVKYIQLREKSWLPYAHFALLCGNKQYSEYGI